MEISKKKEKALPVIIETFTGKGMRVSNIEIDNQDGPKSFQRLYLLSSTHKRKMKELPY